MIDTIYAALIRTIGRATTVKTFVVVPGARL